MWVQLFRFLLRRLAVSLPLIKSGKARGLVIMGTKRSKLLPDLEAVPEGGLTEFDYAGNWFGFLAPAKTPQATIDKLAQLCSAMSEAPDVIAQLDAQGSTAIGSKPADFKKLIASEAIRWAKVARDAGIKLGDN